MKKLLLLLCLFVPCSFAGAIVTFTDVQVIPGAGGFLAHDPNSVSGTQLFSAAFGPPPPGGPYPQVLLSYSGTSAVTAGILHANISLNVGAPFNGSSPFLPAWQGASGAAIAEWKDTWSLATSANVINGNLVLTFDITGSGEASLNLIGKFEDGTPFFVPTSINGFGTRTVTVSIPLAGHGKPTEIATRLIAGGGGIGFFPASYSSSYQNTVILSGLALKDSTGTPVSFTLDTASGDPFFAALAPSSVTDTPEPASWSFALVGLAALGYSRRRRL